MGFAEKRRRIVLWLRDGKNDIMAMSSKFKLRERLSCGRKRI